ncbi:MAG: hypothetical protein U0271_38045 [Polyangiaceae bacterium]
MNRVGRIGRLLLLTGIGLGASCGGTTPNPNTASAAHEGRSARKKPEGENVPFTLPYEVPKLHLLPDVEGSRGLITRSAEGENRLLGRMRLHTTEAGVIERADDLLPAGDVRALKLPTRLGGGFMFIAVADRGTELWRAETWLAPLTPIAALGSNIDARRPIVLGFDRLYVRTRQSEVVGIDPTVPGGALVGLGSLPVAPGYGDMVFLDGWRAVVDTDLAGTFATFDAGATWRKLNLASRVRMISPSSEDADDGDEALISVDGGVYTLTADGHLTFTQGANDGDSGMMVGTFGTDTKGTPPGVLGRKPLRVALEKGYPDSATSAVVLHEGAVVRVSLEDGAILDSKLHAYPEEHADCTGIALGADSADPADDVGFVCGEEHGGTVIYAYERPTGVREVMRFSTPRSVVESGQGAIVVRGPCTDREPEATVRPFCVRFVDGTTREVRVRGDVGAERVIALEDGRVVILVPPRPGAQGQISILEGQASKHVVLKLPDTGVPREFETGMWVDGFQQSAKDEIAGWVEEQAALLGVRIKLDGTVALGEFVERAERYPLRGALLCCDR